MQISKSLHPRVYVCVASLQNSLKNPFLSYNLTWLEQNTEQINQYSALFILLIKQKHCFVVHIINKTVMNWICLSNLFGKYVLTKINLKTAIFWKVFKSSKICFHVVHVCYFFVLPVCYFFLSQHFYIKHFVALLFFHEHNLLWFSILKKVFSSLLFFLKNLLKIFCVLLSCWPLGSRKTPPYSHLYTLLANQTYTSYFLSTWIKQSIAFRRHNSFW